MDYLRRLHPAHADRSSAARLDAPVAMVAAVALSPATLEELVPSPDASRPAAPGTTAPGASQRTLTEPSPRAAPLAEVSAPHAAPRRPSAEAETAPQPMQLTRLPVPPSALPARAMPSSLDATAQSAQPAAAPPLTHADAWPSPATRQPEPSAVAVALQPLRLEAVREREHGSAEEPAPIIHVTIDRIDVRLPSTAATPPAPGRRRAAPTVGALGDYLRGRPPETR